MMVLMCLMGSWQASDVSADTATPDTMLSSNIFSNVHILPNRADTASVVLMNPVKTSTATHGITHASACCHSL